MTVGTCSCGEVFRDDNPLNQPKDIILLHSTAGHSVRLWNQGCGRKLGPFDCCTVVCGDCLELMKQLPDGCVDAVITDPPYGMGLAEWDSCEPPWQPDAFRIADDRVLYFHSPLHNVGAHVGWVFSARHVWDKQHANSRYHWEQICEFRREGIAHSWTHRELPILPGYDQCAKELEKHPCQKPLAVLKWVVGLAGNPHTILDPFLGSGTTAVAAKKLGRHFLGFEISPEYCEIARKRIALVEAQPTLFEKKPEQLEL